MYSHILVTSHLCTIVSCCRAGSVQGFLQKDGVPGGVHVRGNAMERCGKVGGSGGKTGGENGGGTRLSVKNMNQQIVKLQYAVRGPLLLRAVQLETELREGKANKPFKKVIRANLGDAHAMGQKPNTFFRQVLSGILMPSSMDAMNYPQDVKDRVKLLLSSMNGAVGAYSASNGWELIRRRVAEFIQMRDGHNCNWQNVVLSSGASTAIKNILSLFSYNTSGKPSGLMIPIPCFPLYTAATSEFNLYPVKYYLDEEKQWGLNLKELERALKQASKYSQVRAIVVINPGNPTGQVLTKTNIEEVIKFAHKYKLFILADEVYQDNIHDACSKFWSFKKILHMLGKPYTTEVQLASFMSMSKGFIGECGLRGGWMELLNLDPQVQAHLYKMISSNICSSILGQVAMFCYARPPQPGEPSYELFNKEKIETCNSLKQRAELIFDTFKKMEGFQCNLVQGAMYAFPKLNLPPKAIETAKKEGKAPDVFYAFRLLEETGICVVPGSGFGQKKGTYHFRTTILPPKRDLELMMKVFLDFHTKFTKEFT